MRPPPLLPLSFGFPAQQPPSPSSTSLSPWCPRDLRRRSPDFGPRGELPSSSLLLSLPLPPLLLLCAPSLFPARARPCPPRSPAARPRPALPARRRRGPAPPPARCARPRPSPGPRRRPPPRPLLARDGALPPCSRAAVPRPPARPAWPRRGPGTAFGPRRGPQRLGHWCSPRRGPGAASGPRRLGHRCSPRRGLGPLRAASRPSAWLAWPWRGLALPRSPLTRSRVRKPARAVTIS
jgi:hypothetical protein